MKITRKINLIIMTILSISLIGCEETPEDEEATNATGRVIIAGTPVTAKSNTGSTAKAEEVPAAEVKLPTVTAINLVGLGQTSTTALSLAEDDDSDEKCSNDNWGIMGLALGAACHIGSMAHEIAWGEASGDITCADVRAATEATDNFGIMHHLICEELFMQNDEVVSFAHAEETEAFAISFEDFDDGDAAGHWTVTPEALGTYPANVTIWNSGTSADLADLVPFINFDFPTAIDPENGFANGTYYINGEALAEEMGFTMKAKIEVEYHTVNSDCITSPSKENCDFMHVNMYSGEGLISDGPPNGFRLKMAVDDKANPTFYAIEGRYFYSPETAAAMFGELAFGADVSEIYFQFIQKDGLFRAMFNFMDSDGATLSWSTPGGDILALLSAAEGVCQKPSSDSWMDSSSDDYSSCPSLADYSDFWSGKDVLTAVKSDPRGITQLTTPTVEGCTTSGGSFEIEDCFGKDSE